jgi:hypothetical protein
MRQTLGHFLPGAFCAVIAVLALARWAGSETGGASPVFLAFLPICFLLMGLLTLRLQREVGELRRQVQDLEAKRP